MVAHIILLELSNIFKFAITPLSVLLNKKKFSVRFLILLYKNIRKLIKHIFIILSQIMCHYNRKCPKFYFRNDWLQETIILSH